MPNPFEKKVESQPNETDVHEQESVDEAPENQGENNVAENDNEVDDNNEQDVEEKEEQSENDKDEDENEGDDDEVDFDEIDRIYRQAQDIINNGDTKKVAKLLKDNYKYRQQRRELRKQLEALEGKAQKLQELSEKAQKYDELVFELSISRAAQKYGFKESVLRRFVLADGVKLEEQNGDYFVGGKRLDEFAKTQWSDGYGALVDSGTHWIQQVPAGGNKPDILSEFLKSVHKDRKSPFVK